MEFQISEEPIATLSEHSKVSIAYTYENILELTIVDGGVGGFVFTERILDVPVTKDYDKVGDPPSAWAWQFDVAKWGLIVARVAEVRVAGAVIAFDSDGVEMLERRRDLSVLWDLRVDAKFRGFGIGAALFKAAEDWSLKHGCNQMKVETQNTNIAACKFYQRQGCTLGGIKRFAYPTLPDEVQMLWFKELASASFSSS